MRIEKLGNICDIQSGGTPARSKSEFWEDGTIPWVKISDIQDKFLNKTEELITNDGLDNSSAKLFPKGTILYTIFATLGEVCILNIDAATNQAIAGISIKNDKKQILDTDYLYYFLMSIKEMILRAGRGVAQNNINLKILRSIEVPIPSVANQRNIAQALSKVESLIAMRKQQISKLDELVKSRFIEMFGDPELNPMKWNVLKIAQLTTVDPQNGLYKPQSSYVENNMGVPILRIDAFYNGKVSDYSCLKRLKCSKDELAKYLLMENDIVINRVNSIEYLGKCALIRGLLEHTVFESNMMRFHLDEKKIVPLFATYLLCTTYMKKQILNRAKKAVNQASINQKDVMSFQMIKPPLELQNEFADFVKSTDKSKTAIQKSLDDLETLKKSLMQQYFA